MSFRNIDSEGDWTFGAGTNSYAIENNEILLNVKTRIMSFLGDCFFDTEAGIDWFNLLEYNKQSKIENDVQNVIINTDGVVNINSIDVTMGANRKIILSYDIDTIYTQQYQDSLQLSGII